MRGVMRLSRTYKDLNDLLQSEGRARTFFMKQPDYVQGGVMQQSFAIHSLQSLEDAARSMRHIVE